MRSRGTQILAILWLFIFLLFHFTISHLCNNWMLYRHSPNVAVRAIDAIVVTKGLRFISQLYAEIFVVCYLVYLHGWDSSQFLRLILKLTNWRTCRICSEGLCLFYVALLFSLLNGNILLQSLQVQAQIY